MYCSHSPPPAAACLQLEVESFYTCRNYLIAQHHEVYWIGLRSSLARSPAQPPPPPGSAPPPTPTPRPPPAGGVLGPDVGLSGAALRNFTWLDPDAPAFWNVSAGNGTGGYLTADMLAQVAQEDGESVYLHWGVLLPDGVPEPNAQLGQEACGVANASEAYLRDRNSLEVGPGGAWGWADASCGGSYYGMCRLQGELGSTALLASWCYLWPGAICGLVGACSVLMATTVGVAQLQVNEAIACACP